MTDLSFSFNKSIDRLLDELSECENISKPEAMRRAILFYHYIKTQTNVKTMKRIVLEVESNFKGLEEM